MAFAARESIWSAEMRQPVYQALARIANAISVYEPVKMLVNAADVATARQLCGSNVQLIEHPIDDLWMRDTGCVFVRNPRGERAAVSFNFNGWGNQQAHARDATVAARMAELTGLPLLRSSLVLEGGGIEVDGQGTAIITESCVLNKNRNPGVSKAQAEVELKRMLGLEKIIWLPGIAGRDITDGHTDFYARFVKPGVVVAALETDEKSFDHPVTRRHLETAERSHRCARPRLADRHAEDAEPGATGLRPQGFRSRLCEFPDDRQGRVFARVRRCRGRPGGARGACGTVAQPPDRATGHRRHRFGRWRHPLHHTAGAGLIRRLFRRSTCTFQ
jgi:hypothetical protein